MDDFDLAARILEKIEPAGFGHERNDFRRQQALVRMRAFVDSKPRTRQQTMKDQIQIRNGGAVRFILPGQPVADEDDGIGSESFQALQIVNLGRQVRLRMSGGNALQAKIPAFADAKCR